MGTAATSALVLEWLEFMHQQGKSQHTIGAYHRGVQHFLSWYEQAYHDEMQCHLVMPRDIRDWKAHQQTIEKAAPTTVNQRLVAITRFFDWARKNGHRQDNPAEDVPSIRLATRQPKGMKSADVRRLLRTAQENPRDAAILELLIGAGLRVGELLALTVGDLELNERSGKVIIRQSKQSGYREVPLTADVRIALKKYLEAEHPDPKNPDAPLWFTHRGPLQHRSSILRLLERYTLQAGLEPISPHILRHTFATRYLAANPGDVRGLASLLGHSNLNTVMIYTEPHLDDLAQRLERMELG